jgi:protein-S-isoprenylcysteine O-methyltransferase Ste14
VNDVRYVLALLVLVMMPPGVALWFAIHPFARFWRRFGAGWTYAILSVPSIGLMVAAYLLRRPLLRVEYGTNWVLVGLGAIVFGAAMTIGWKRRKLLTPGVLAGVPELSNKSYPGRLLTEGPYAVVRHPRYVEVALGTLGYALITNYLAIYILTALSVLALYLIALLEERELLERFGSAYADYAARVPRWVPRRGGRSSRS